MMPPDDLWAGIAILAGMALFMLVVFAVSDHVARKEGIPSYPPGVPPPPPWLRHDVKHFDKLERKEHT